MTMSNTSRIVEVRQLTKKFKLARGVYLHAVDDVSLDIYDGEILGLVGESGCGKSTLGRLIIRLHQETAGQITMQGRDISGKLPRGRRRELARAVQLIFQDPYSALN